MATAFASRSATAQAAAGAGLKAKQVRGPIGPQLRPQVP
jgi:hypothetical protein